MKKYLTSIIFLLLFGLSFILRYHGYRDRAPFDWDQNRDYGEVQKIVAGEYVPLGPVAKGVEGGFYLGSFYYYLLVPAFQATHGDLASLPLTSLFIDSLVPGFIFLFFRKKFGFVKTLSVAVLWSIFWTAIDSSRTSWNVSLVPLWSVFTLKYLAEFLEIKSDQSLFGLAFLFGLSFHIHVAAIPVIPLFALIFIRRLNFPLRTWLQAGLFGIVPLIPLIQYDLTHDLKNLHLVHTYLLKQNMLEANILEVIESATAKLGKISIGFLTAHAIPSLSVGIATIIYAVHRVIYGRNLPRIAGIFVLVSYGLIIALRDSGFPEYYFGPAFIAISILIVDCISHFWKPLFYVAIATIVYLNINTYQFDRTSYCLADKEDIVQSLALYQVPIDIRINVLPGREGGLEYLIQRDNIVRQDGAQVRILITDDLESPLYIDGELAEDQNVIGHLRTAKHILQ